MGKKVLITLTLAAACAGAGIATAVARGSSGSNGTPYHAGRASSTATFSISNCWLPKTDFITNDVFNLTTTSTSYVPVPGMTKRIWEGGSKPGCLLVDVSAYSYAKGTALEFVSVTLDGVQGKPFEVQFSGNDGEWAEAHAAQFAFSQVAPGYHHVSLVFNSFDGQAVFIDEPAMSVRHS
jgi:hypothetical protein